MHASARTADVQGMAVDRGRRSSSLRSAVRLVRPAEVGEPATVGACNPGGGDPMTEPTAPTTGATKEQIEAAARAIFDEQNRRNFWDSTWESHGGRDHPFNRQVMCRAEAREALAAAAAIAPADRVVTDEDVAALRRAI